jgi:hypothetical protein
MRIQKVITLMLLLLIAATFLSCKSPISPTPAGPTLTLTLPDSARALDSVTFRAHYSDSIKPTWDYAWQFGDSAKATTRDTSITHIYDSAGTYTVQVALTDTVLRQTIAKQTGQIKIMPLNAPTLTLIVPDTNFWGDSCVMSVSSSQPLKATWAFTWSFGDSTSLTSARDTVIHYYLAPQTFTVRVELNDTAKHIFLGSQTASIQVIAPALSLTVPNSVFWGDSAELIVQSSRILKSSWSYTWAFGDSTSLTSSEDTIQHYFLNPGTLTIRVTLNDTIHHILLASQSASISVTARHFNLALLQLMPYVDVTWNANIIKQFPCSLCGGSWGGSAKPLAWSGTLFTMDTTYKFSSPDPMDFDSGGGGNSESGNIDPGLTQLVKFSSDTNGYLNSGETNGGSWCYSTSSSSFNITNVPFKQESDSDVVFEASGNLLRNASYNYSGSSNDRFLGNCSLQWYPIWTDMTANPYIIIRFHK